MVNRIWVYSVGLVGMILAAGACATRPPGPGGVTPTPSPRSVSAGAAGLAVVERIEIAPPARGAAQTTVTAYGQLADGCTELAGTTVERTAQTLIVTLSTLRQPAETCAAEARAFTHPIALDLAGLAAGDYVVVVNGASGQLRLEETVQPTPAAPTPTAPPKTDPTPTPDPLPTQSIPVTGDQPSNCSNRAAFYGDVTVPDDTLFKQGEAFVKTWKVRNEGTCTWRGYNLVFAGGDQMSGPLASPLPETPPNTIVEISVSLVAPTRGGSHLSNWEMQDAEGRRFGVGASQKGPVWVRISVNFSGQEGTVPSLADLPANPPAPVASVCGATRDGGAESQVLQLINAARGARGLGTVNVQAQLAAAAGLHGADMACHNFISHTGTDGTSWKHRVANQGYANYNSSREIIYAGSPGFGGDPQGAFDWWFASQVHHDIILHTDVSQLGIASMANPRQPGMTYYAVVFARP